MIKGLTLSSIFSTKNLIQYELAKGLSEIFSNFRYCISTGFTIGGNWDAIEEDIDNFGDFLSANPELWRVLAEMDSTMTGLWTIKFNGASLVRSEYVTKNDGSKFEEPELMYGFIQFIFQNPCDQDLFIENFVLPTKLSQ